jgi:ferric-dicitrate binding protein FerR (iron transport regulator)
LRSRPPSSRNVNVVISHGAWRYDFRVMTEMELEEFVAELLRARPSELQAPLLTPN